MKKILLASTAVFAVSGAAAFAQVSDGISIEGNAEMGVFGSGGSADVTTMGVLSEADADQPLQFFQSIDLDIVGSGTTDGGLTFGFDLDIDEADNLGTETDDMGTTVFVSSDFGTVTMGDTDGALDFVMTEAGNIGNPGSINDAETVHLGYLGAYLDGSGDGQIVRYDYTFDAFTFALSAEQHAYERNDNTSISGKNDDGLVANEDDDITWAIGFGYTFEFAGGSVDTGIGYQYSDNGEIEFEFDDAGFANPLTVGGLQCTSVPTGEFELDADTGAVTQTVTQDECTTTEVAATGVGATVNLDNGFSAGFTYTMFDFDGLDKNVHHTGLGVGYAFDAISLHANYGQYATPAGGDINGYGLAAGYDLGGGASLLAGYSRSNADDLPVGNSVLTDTSFDIYSLGLSFSF